MKKTILSVSITMWLLLVGGCADQSGTKPAADQGQSAGAVEKPARPTYRRSVPPAVNATEFKKAGTNETELSTAGKK